MDTEQLKIVVELLKDTTGDAKEVLFAYIISGFAQQFLKNIFVVFIVVVIAKTVLKVVTAMNEHETNNKIITQAWARVCAEVYEEPRSFETPMHVNTVIERILELKAKAKE